MNNVKEGGAGEGRDLIKKTNREGRGKGKSEKIDKVKEFLKWELKRGKVMN